MRNVYISDKTLRSVNPSALSFKEKIELAKLLDRLNVSAVEMSPIENRRIDSLLIKSVASAVKHSAVAVPVGQDEESVDVTWAALKEARHPRLQVIAPMSPAQMEYFWHKKPDKLLDAIRALVTHSRKYCADVEFVADDACRSEGAFLRQAIIAAVESGATAVTVCDAAGLMLPDEFAAFIGALRRDIPQLADARLGVSCSDALSMASSCAVTAVGAGACDIKVTSYGDSAPRLTAVAAIFKNRGDSLGASVDLRYTEMKRISDQIDRMCNPVATGITRELGEAVYEKWTLTAHDDRAAVLKAVEKIGYDLSEEDAAKVYEAFCRIAAQKSTVGAKELDTIVASVALQVPPTYRLTSYVINCGNVIRPSAQIKLTRNDEALEGICLGDGPIDASLRTIEQIVGRRFEVDDFRLRAVTEGQEAMGEAVIRLRAEGKLYSGCGISTDIIGATIHAYLNALNKIVYEEA